MTQEFFRLAVPEVGLSIEQNTENVPQDGKYHVLKQGAIVASYPSLKRARERLQRLKDEAGFVPQSAREDEAGDELASKEHVERLLDAHGRYWGASHKFRGKGGRGGRGGV